MSLPSSSVGRNSMPFQAHLPDRELLWQQTYLEAFQKNYDSVQRWTRWQEDHEQVKSTLAKLPDKLCHEVVIPFGSKALIKAKLVHTNEVLTSIGSSWFVKQSTRQGIEMCDRRIKQSKEMLQKLENERTLFTNRQTLPKLEEAFPSGMSDEIIEPYDEEAEAEWRSQHKLREAEYRRKLAELRQKQIDQPPVETEVDIFRRLDELELEEELNDELERLHAEYEADDENNDEEDEGEGDSTDSNGSENEEEDNSGRIEASNLFVNSGTMLSRPKQLSPEKILKLEKSGGLSYLKDSNSNSTPNNSMGSLSKETEEKNSIVDLEAMKKNRRISFADEAQPFSDVTEGDLEEHLYIRFHHTEEPLNQGSSHKVDKAATKINDEAQVFVSPADIYNYHKEHVMSSNPKSILKKSSSYPEKIPDGERPMQSSASFGSRLGITFSDSEDENTHPVRDLSHLPPVLCDVQEKAASASQPSAPEPSRRPTSRFKLSRQGGKRQ